MYLILLIPVNECITAEIKTSREKTVHIPIEISFSDPNQNLEFLTGKIVKCADNTYEITAAADENSSSPLAPVTIGPSHQDFFLQMMTKATSHKHGYSYLLIKEGTSSHYLRIHKDV